MRLFILFLKHCARLDERSKKGLLVMKPKKNSHSSRNVHREPKSYKAQLLRAHLAKKAPFISKISPIIGLRYISFHKFFSRAKKLNFSSVAFKNHYTQWLDKRREGGMGIRSCFQFTHTKITRSFGGPRAALGATATQTLRMISQYSAKPFIVSKNYIDFESCFLIDLEINCG